MTDELPFESARELAARMRAGDHSPVEVTEAYLDRIADRNDDLNAYLTVIDDEARAAAVDAERAVERGDDLGPLHGVPVAIKDLTAFKSGVRHTFGCRAFGDNVADHTTTFVRRLEAAGAIVLGKTNTPEFGHRTTTDNLLAGPTCNPFDPTCNAGGSSGGSAAAVAAGLTALGQGGDAGGSVRTPAALCGVYGLKPTAGRVPQPTRPDAFQNHTPFIDKGPITRTVADAALMLDVMAGPDPRDPFSLPAADGSFLAATDRSVEGLDVAYSPDLGVFPVSAAIERCVERATDAFVDAGATVECVDVEFGHDLGTLRDGVRLPQMHLLAAKVARNLAPSGADFLDAYGEDVPDTFRERVERGREYSAMDMANGELLRTDVLDAVLDVFETHDLLVTPTTAVASVPNGALGATSVDGEPVDPTSDWVLTWPFNLTGHPAASVPAGTVDGMPVGMQVVAPRYDEATVLAASAAVERERPWSDLYG
ncbi:amidase [Halomarina oriensis]|uniref:Amidase n=1 Tax=Halomarina oriensis TaxID=671145 RepID=A0A6B0GK93_9EURY|nr:amidase family protein [Halomarina oriensis]MWG33829.1 amidase [Halomarina oriensis]